MIDDPVVSGYRYPQPGEQLWHLVSHRPCVVMQPPAGLSRSDSYVRFADGTRAIVKLRNVDEHPVSA